MRIALLPLILLAMPGCAQRFVPVEAGTLRTPRIEVAAAKVLVVQGQDAGRPTEVVGIVDVHEPMDSQAAALVTLKARAALLGADAVLGVELHHDPGETKAKELHEDGPVTHLSGMAVKYRPVLLNRPYDVVGEVEVDTPMGHEDEGMEALRAKARDVNADAVLDAQFRHGEGGDKTHISGTAIKYR